MIRHLQYIITFTALLVLSNFAFAGGEMVVAGGHLTLGDETGLIVPEGRITVGDGSIMSLEGNDTLISAKRLIVRAGGVVVGCGVIDAELFITGDVVADCGEGSCLQINQKLTLVDGIERDGLLRATNSSEIKISGSSVVNKGLIELLEGSLLTVSADLVFTNEGTVDLRDGRIDGIAEGFSFGGTLLTPAASEISHNLGKPQRNPISGDWEITIYGIEGKSYLLKTNTTLDSATWGQVETRLADSFGRLTFTYPHDALESQRFWSFDISDSPTP